MKGIKKVLVTGANGFVGTEFCKRMDEEGYQVLAATRLPRLAGSGRGNVVPISIGDISSEPRWAEALEGVTHVVHLAARVHAMQERSDDPMAEHRLVNVKATENLARQAASAGVKRFVYVSTIKVNGEQTVTRPFRADDEPRPQDSYARSKLEAEFVLKDIGRGTGMEIVIIRPPLVYGPGVKGNFLSILRVISRGWPLPLASCDNRRSFLGLTNLVDLLLVCVLHPSAANRVVLASDGEDLSTPELLRRIARAMGRRARLFPIPRKYLRWTARIVQRPGIYGRLCESLEIDAGETRKLLSWGPPLRVDEELERTAKWFFASSR